MRPVTRDGDPRRAGGPTDGTRARVERAALDLFTLRGFENVTIDEVADAAGISRRTFFRYFATKADAVWGDFAGHVARLEGLLAATDPAQPVLASVCAAYVEVNDYPDAELPLLRERMQLILTEPALLAHSQLRYADVDRVVAGHVAARTGASPRAVPLVAAAPWRRPPGARRRRRRSRPGWPTTVVASSRHLRPRLRRDGRPPLRPRLTPG